MNQTAENEWVTGKVEITLDGQPLKMEMTVPAFTVKPQRMLPVFQQMTNSFVDIGIGQAHSRGESISCKKGCGACCRQPVPLAEIEAYQIAELVAQMPEPRQTAVKERFEKAFAHFAEIGWFERLGEAATQTPREQEQVVTDYFREGIPCPFLVDESCSIHQDRPLACREYLVTSPAENCSSPTQETVDKIPLPVNAAVKILPLGQTKVITGVNFIPLVLALKWVEMNEDRFPEKTGEEWMADFFRNLTKSKIPNQETAEG